MKFIKVYGIRFDELSNKYVADNYLYINISSITKIEPYSSPDFSVSISGKVFKVYMNLNYYTFYIEDINEIIKEALWNLLHTKEWWTSL